MRYDSFARSYETGRTWSWSSDEQGRLLTAQAAAWAEHFDRILFDHLSGGSAASDARTAQQVIAHYREWHLGSFVSTVRLLEATGHGNAVRLMHFHTLTNCLLLMWRAVAGHPSRPTITQRRQAQLLIALHAATMVTTREHQVSAAAEAPAVRAARHGMLTESDAAIVLLELIRHRPGILLVPAPPSFEAGPGHGAGRNVDLLLLDAVRRTVAGIQIKTRVSPATRQRYDPDLVTIIDGSLDLGNERLVRRSPRHSDLVREAWPGLISAHFVLRANPRTAAFRPWARAIEEQRAGLAETVHGTSDYLARAVAQVRGRVLARLDAE